MRHLRHSKLGLLLALAALAPASACDDEGESGGSPVGASYRVPYRLTETNHFIVRARIDGRGPFNFVVDTGAPALFLSREAAERAGLEVGDGKYFSRIDRLEFEGGAALTDVQARIEDIMQVVGMNALGLPGVRLDGMVGFNVLARFRIAIDPTEDRMAWTRIDHEPPDLPEPPGGKSRAPAEVQAMNALGGVAQLAAMFVGKQPEDTLIPRGFVGLELAESEGEDGPVAIAAVLPGSPAEGAELRPGDRLVEVEGIRVRSIADALRAVSAVEPGDRVTLRVEPSGGGDESESRGIELTAGEGL